jgi:hypothetical protein
MRKTKTKQPIPTDTLQRLADLIKCVDKLLAASGHMSPFGGEGSVQAVRRAGIYMAAFDGVKIAVENARAALAAHRED